MVLSQCETRVGSMNGFWWLYAGALHTKFGDTILQFQFHRIIITTSAVDGGRFLIPSRRSKRFNKFSTLRAACLVFTIRPWVPRSHGNWRRIVASSVQFRVSTTRFHNHDRSLDSIRSFVFLRFLKPSHKKKHTIYPTGATELNTMNRKKVDNPKLVRIFKHEN